MLFGDSLWIALIVQDHILAVSLVFGKICKIWHYWMVCVYLFSTLRILLSFWDLSGYGAEGRSGTNWLSCPVEMLMWLSFIFNIAPLCLQYVENANPLVFLHVFTVDLNYWSLFVLLQSLFRGYFLSSEVYSILFSVICKHEKKSSCLLVTTLVCTIVFETAIQFCLWLLLSSYWLCHKVALSCSIDTGVIPKPWDWSAMVLWMPLIKTISGTCSSSHNLHTIRG